MSHLTIGDIILSNCRFCNGVNGNVLLNRWRKYDFNIYSNWEAAAREWGYTELPDRVINIIAFLSRRNHCWRLLTKFLKELKYPNLQGMALIYAPNLKWYVEYIAYLKANKQLSTSLLWILLEIWQERIKIELRDQTDKDKWLNKDAKCIIDEMFDVLDMSSDGKYVERWLFDKKYRHWRNAPFTDVQKGVYLLMEDCIIKCWDFNMFNSEINEEGYLTFISNDVDRCHPINSSDAEIVLKSFNEYFLNGQLSGFDEITKEKLYFYTGYGKMLYRVNAYNILSFIKRILTERECHFEGWKQIAKQHNYKNVIAEMATFSALLIMVYNEMDIASLDKNEINKIVINKLQCQTHCCHGDADMKYYKCAHVIARSILYKFDNQKVGEYDNYLIKRVNNIAVVIEIFAYTSKYALNNSNKMLLAERWRYEKEAIEGRMYSTNNSKGYKLLEDKVKALFI